jgi:hypothetical protein
VPDPSLLADLLGGDVYDAPCVGLSWVTHLAGLLAALQHVAWGEGWGRVGAAAAMVTTSENTIYVMIKQTILQQLHESRITTSGMPTPDVTPPSLHMLTHPSTLSHPHRTPPVSPLPHLVLVALPFSLNCRYRQPSQQPPALPPPPPPLCPTTLHPPGFLSHSPKKAHSAHCGCVSLQPLGSTGLGGVPPKGATWIHLVADHFSPDRVGQLPWRLAGSF